MIADAPRTLTDRDFALDQWAAVRTFLHRAIRRDPLRFAVILGPQWNIFCEDMPRSSVERLLEVVLGDRDGSERERQFLCHLGKSIQLAERLHRAEVTRFKGKIAASVLGE
ncbi:MAG: hypothetical protein JWM32_198 [Verrucomicrobia bacterium]|nr:hypothetical protein [Verrucomicrobiota bacterium]